MQVYINLYLPVAYTCYICLGYLRYGLYPFLKLLGIFFKLGSAVVSREVDIKYGELRKVDISDDGIPVQVVREVRFGIVHGVFHLVLGHLYINVRIKLNKNE